MSGAAELGQAPVASDPIATQKDNIAQLSEISRNARTTFFALILACAYSYLAIASTTDAALLANSGATPLPIIQVKVPIVWFYYFAPIILAVLFVYFHLYLERFWRCVVRLPLKHPDGRGLDEYVYPWLISSAFIRGEIPQLATGRVSARLEAWLSLFLAWWLIPTVLLFYWARYLIAHDWLGTLLHVLLVLLSAALALRFFYTARSALRKMATQSEHGASNPEPSGNGIVRLSIQERITASTGIGLLAVALIYLSAAAIGGLSEEDCARARSGGFCAFYAPGRKIWEAIGIAPYTEVKEERFVTKPDNWQALLGEAPALRSFLDAQPSLTLAGRNLRSMNAEYAFLPGSRITGGTLDYADLRHAVLAGSRLENVRLRGTYLTDVHLQHVTFANAHFENVDARAAHFDNAKFGGDAAGGQTTLQGDFSGAYFDHASGERVVFHSKDGEQGLTSLREASLRDTSFSWSEFKDVDFGTAKFEGAFFTHNQFESVDFTGSLINNAVLSFSTFLKCRFIATDISDSSFYGSRFSGTEIDGQALTGSPSTAIENGGDVTVSPTVIPAFRGAETVFDEHTRIRNIEFVEAELQGATFEKVDFKNTRFVDSNLFGATFRDVDLSGVSFVKNVNLSAANLEEARNVTPQTLSGACWNAETKLPPGLASELKPRRC